MDADGDLAVLVGRDPEQLHDVAEVVGHLDVAGGDAGDALTRHVLAGDDGVVGDAGEDGELGRGVVAVDVRARVCLGVAQRLCAGQHVGVGRVLGGHPRQDVVRGPVEDPHDPADAVAGQRGAHRADDRDRAADGCLVEQVDAAGVGRRVQQRATLGDQCLVGGDDGRAGTQRLLDVLAGLLDPADDLHDDVDVVGSGHGHGVVRDLDTLGQAAVDGGVTNRHTHELELRPDTLVEVVPDVLEECDDATSDDATTQHPDADGVHVRLPLRRTPRLAPGPVRTVAMAGQDGHVGVDRPTTR